MNKKVTVNNRILTIFKIGIFLFVFYAPLFAYEPFNEEIPSEATLNNRVLMADNTSGLRGTTDVDPDDPNYDPNTINGVGEVPAGDILPSLVFVMALAYGLYRERKQYKKTEE
ncbi:hypothetical protein FACS189463_2620 [Bacteroidia bacterium]|nr:hypothetical protein FACS189463_2620 [Bacteroidia bacterium]